MTEPTEQPPRTRLRTEQSEAAAAEPLGPPPGLSASWQFMPESTHSSPGGASSSTGAAAGPMYGQPPFSSAGAAAAAAAATPAERVYYHAPRHVEVGTGVPLHGGPQHNHRLRIDPKHLDKPQRLDEQASRWKVWKLRLENFLQALDDRFLPAIREAEN